MWRLVYLVAGELVQLTAQFASARKQGFTQTAFSNIFSKKYSII